MAPAVAFPFRLEPSGVVSTVDDRSEAHDAQLIASLCLVRLGERRLFPTFGTPDPAFQGFEPAALAGALAEWGPDVDLDDVEVEQIGETGAQVTISYASGGGVL